MIIKKKKENLSDEFLKRKNLLKYFKDNIRHGTIFNNSDVINVNIDDYKITRPFVIDEWEDEVILTIFWNTVDKEKGIAKESWTLYRDGKFATIIK